VNVVAELVINGRPIQTRFIENKISSSCRHLCQTLTDFQLFTAELNWKLLEHCKYHRTLRVLRSSTLHQAFEIPGGAKKRPEHLHALFTRAVEMNQCKSIYVMIKHLRICVGIFA